MMKKESNIFINLALILGICLLFINTFVDSPQNEAFAFLYTIVKLTILLSATLLFYAQVKRSRKK